MELITYQDILNHLSYRFHEICEEVECIKLSNLDLQNIQDLINIELHIKLERNQVIKILKNLQDVNSSDRLVVTKLQKIDTNKRIKSMLDCIGYDVNRVIGDSDNSSANVLIRRSIAKEYGLTYHLASLDHKWLSKRPAVSYDLSELHDRVKIDYDPASLLYMNKASVANEIESNMSAKEEDFMYKKLTHPSNLYSDITVMADDFIEFFMKPYLKASARYIGDIRLNSYLDRFYGMHIDEKNCTAVALYHEYYRGRKNITDFAVRLSFRHLSMTTDLARFFSQKYFEVDRDPLKNDIARRSFNLSRDVKELQIDLLHEGIFTRLSDLNLLKSGLDTRVKYLTKLAKLKYLDNDLDRIEQLTHEMHEIANRSFCISVNDLLQDDSFKDLDYLSIIKLADSSDNVKLLKTEDLEFLTESFCKTLYHEDALLEYRKIWNLQLIVDSELYDTLKAAEVKFKENQSWKYDSRQRYDVIALDDAIKFYLEKYEHSRSSSMLSAVSTIRSAYRMLIKDRSEDSNAEEIELALDLDLRNQFAQYIYDNCSKLRLYVNSALRLEVA